ncbi:MAG: hypothetical protein KKF56_03445 [Nanoarchaeota archaeon]|nr:hypothetical protein [Nanoarchaeota archaeon]
MVEKDIGKIQKKEDTDIIVRVDEYAGYPGVTIREFTTSERYTGFTKSGTRIPAEKFVEFRELINSIDLGDLKKSEPSSSANKPETPAEQTPTEKPTDEKVDVEEF